MNKLRLASAVLALLMLGPSVSAQQSIEGKHRKIFSGGGGGGPSAFAYIASSVTGCYNGNAGATTCSYNLHQNPGAGHLGVVMVEWQSASATPTFSCTNNTTWTAIGSPKVGIGANAGYSGQMFRIFSMVAGAAPEQCVLTISSSVNFLFWEYAEYSYTGSLSSLDGTPQYSNTAASGSVATISGLTTSNSSDLIFAACIGVATTCNLGSGYTARNDTNACQNGATGNCSGGTTGKDLNGVIGSLIEERVNVAGGAQTATFGTNGATDDVILGLVGF